MMRVASYLQQLRARLSSPLSLPWRVRCWWAKTKMIHAFRHARAQAWWYHRGYYLNQVGWAA